MYSTEGNANKSDCCCLLVGMEGQAMMTDTGLEDL